MENFKVVPLKSDGKAGWAVEWTPHNLPAMVIKRFFSTEAEAWAWAEHLASVGAKST